MRIAIVSFYVTTDGVDPKYYSSQQMSLARALTDKGYIVDVYTSHVSGKKKVKFVDGIKIRFFPRGWVFLNKYGLQTNMKGLRLNGKYDYVIVSDDFNITTLQMAGYCRETGTKMILFQGIYRYSDSFFKGFYMKGFDLLFGWYIRRSTWCVIAKTKAAKVFMEKKRYQCVEYVPVGYDKSLFFEEKKKGEKNKDKFKVLYVGNIIERRNLPMLFRAYKEVKKIRKDAELIVIGDGPEKRRLMIMADEMGLDVSFLGCIEKDKLYKYYNMSDVFAFSSNREIFGMVILEAMACGCPVVSTPVPAAKDLIMDGFNGRIVDFDDHKAMADAILSGMSGLRIDVSRLEWDRIADRYMEILV